MCLENFNQTTETSGLVAVLHGASSSTTHTETTSSLTAFANMQHMHMICYKGFPVFMISYSTRKRKKKERKKEKNWKRANVRSTRTIFTWVIHGAANTREERWHKQRTKIYYRLSQTLPARWFHLMNYCTLSCSAYMWSWD